MKDINFFESYIERRQFQIDKKWIYYSVAILLILLITFNTLVNQIKLGAYPEILLNSNQSLKTIELVKRWKI